jgi:Transcriptional regulator containing an amidase domain and an AraC-type DNA-binding HTH domain
MSTTVAVVISEAFLRRLASSLASMARRGTVFRIVDNHHPVSRIRHLVRASKPSVVLTEWMPGMMESLLALGYPTILVGVDDVFPGAVSLDVDDEAVGVAAAEYYLAAGYRSFGFVGVDTPYSVQRLGGFSQRLAAEGMTPAVHIEKEVHARHYLEIWHHPSSALRRWLRKLPKPAGIFAAHDPLGRLVCEAGRELKLSIPEDVAVIGANNDEMVCPLSNPPLSSIVIPWNRLASEAGNWVEALSRGTRPPRQPLLFAPGGVAARQSTTLLAVEDADVRRVLQFMRETFDEPVTVEMICDELRLTRRTIERRFVQYLRATPWEILTRFRIDRAKTLLTTTDLSISRIAEASGFGDVERFSTLFRQRVGKSPSKYRTAAG